jgi:hypothetical protein
MSRGFWIVLLLAVAATVMLFTAWYPYTGGGRQHYNMAIAQEELPKVQAVLDADKRFKDVKAYVYTGQDGSVILVGTVNTDEDLFRLMKAVAAERLPVVVSWQVKVAAEDGS